MIDQYGFTHEVPEGYIASPYDGESYAEQDMEKPPLSEEALEDLQGIFFPWQTIA